MTKQRFIKTTVVFEELAKHDERVVILEGSSRSSKTFSIIQNLMQKILTAEKEKKPVRVLILRSRLTWLKGSLLPDFKKVMDEQFGLWKDKSFNKQEMAYVFRGGSTITFGGLDTTSGDGQKFHGAKYDYVWFNECNDMNFVAVRQILIRMTKQAFFDYNPNFDPETHWLYTVLRKRNDVCVIHSTYKDNPFLEKEIVEEIESLEPTPENIANGTASETAWKIYGLGLPGTLKGLIFKNFKTVSEIPDEEWDWMAYGLDFGYHPDPTALIEVRACENRLYLRELIYKRGLSVFTLLNDTRESLETLMLQKKVRPDIPIFCDLSDGRERDDIRMLGYDARKAKKGPGSLKMGIEIMKRYVIHIAEESQNLIEEFNKYQWKRSREGEELQIPVDKFNHGIDATRYAVTSPLSKASTEINRHNIRSLRITADLSSYGYGV